MNKILNLLFLFIIQPTLQAQNDTCLVEVKKHIPDIYLDIRYATENNFTGRKVYTSGQCFLRYEVVKALAKVQEELKSHNLRLLIYDGYRPRRVQYIFWEIMPDERYVLHPAKGSRHNRGAAVDLTLAYADGKPLEMCSDYDDFSEKAHSSYSPCSTTAIQNRTLLQNLMVKHGFTIFETEWWHFDYQGWEKFHLLDIPFENIADNCK